MWLWASWPHLPGTLEEAGFILLTPFAIGFYLDEFALELNSKPAQDIYSALEPVARGIETRNLIFWEPLFATIETVSATLVIKYDKVFDPVKDSYSALEVFWLA